MKRLFCHLFHWRHWELSAQIMPPKLRFEEGTVVSAALTCMACRRTIKYREMCYFINQYGGKIILLWHRDYKVVPITLKGVPSEEKPQAQEPVDQKPADQGTEANAEETSI